jgi:hypothetical protein
MDVVREGVAALLQRVDEVLQELLGCCRSGMGWALELPVSTS